jgi:tRNA(Arg) A34 adenosine deaminase TadA
MIDDTDRKHLKRCIELAEEALACGDEPFGSVLVSAEGHVLFEDHNWVVTEGDPTRHPEIKIARWAAKNMSPEERASATVYTSGEHCPMCAAAHGWVGLGRVVYASSAAQLSSWMKEFGNGRPAVNPLPIEEIVRDIDVDGPVPELAEQVGELHRHFHKQK